MVYDEEYFHFDRVRLISDMEISFQDLNDIESISTYYNDISLFEKII